jgi:hypothetical protein
VSVTLSVVAAADVVGVCRGSYLVDVTHATVVAVVVVEAAAAGVVVVVVVVGGSWAGARSSLLRMPSVSSSVVDAAVGASGCC